MFYQRRADIIDQVELRSPRQVTHLPPVIFYFPWQRHQIEGTNGFYCLIRKTLAKWGKGSFQMVSAGFEPETTRLSVARSNH